MSVSPMLAPVAIWAIAPVTIAPATAPPKAPTIPPRKRSGTNTVKCQRATPIVNQTTAAISESPSSRPPVLPLATATLLLALAGAAQGCGARLAQLGLLLGEVRAVAGRGRRLGRLARVRGGLRLGGPLRG